jgi:hypothetical protein
MRDGDQLGHAVHLHRAVAREDDDRTVRVGELPGDAVWDTGTHGGEIAR